MPAINKDLHDKRRKRSKRQRHRFISPLHFHHVSSRTIEGRYAFHVFDPLFVALAWGIVAAASNKYSVRVAAFVLMSNHMHALVKGPSAVAVSRWKQYVKSNLALLANRWCDRSGSVWDGRFRSSTLLDTESEQRWFRYILAHGTKEGLVAAPTAWPGVHCAAALRAGTAVQGLLGKVAALEARAAGRDDPRAECAEIEMSFAPLTAWEGRPAAAWRRQCTQTIDAIIADYAPAGLPLTYAHAELNWGHVPDTLKRSTCPRFDACGPARESLLAAAYSALESGITHAHEQMAALVEAGRASMALFDGLQWPTPVVEVLLPNAAGHRPVPAHHSEGALIDQTIGAEVVA